MRIARPHRLLALPLATLSLAACGGGTDITRTDDEVEEWVAEQQAEERDRKAGKSQLPRTVAPGQAAPDPVAPAPQASAPAAAAPAPCSAAWNAELEAKLQIADAEGHGPDPGSAEWKSAVEHKLGVRDDASFPEPGTAGWCERVDQLVRQR